MALLAVVGERAGAGESHAIAMHGAPALPADFTHMPYANPDAPKGGDMRLASLGTFDTLNPYTLRGEAAPEPRPHLKLTAPSGEVWLYNDPSESELIEGSAEAFCQVVTQVRNIADTGLKVVGPNARNWMSKAQCFAGDAETPPAAGTRKTVVRA
mgnify:CR=1 FL=1